MKHLKSILNAQVLAVSIAAGTHGQLINAGVVKAPMQRTGAIGGPGISVVFN